MRFPHILFAGAIIFLPGCSTTPRQNDQQAFESDLSEARIFLKTLQTLDSGDVAKTRQVALIPVCVDMASLPTYAAKIDLTAEQKLELTSVAKGTLDYLLAHRQEFDGRLPSIQACVRGMQRILNEPDDVRRLQELSGYYAEREKQMTRAQKP